MPQETTPTTMSAAKRRVVALLMTDVEHSTRLWASAPEQAGERFARLESIIEACAGAYGGRTLKTHGEGDSSFSAFDEPASAVAAAIELQRRARAENLPRLRCGIHVGPVEERDGDLFGLAAGRCARIRDLGHGGQILCSSTAAALLNPPPADADWRIVAIGDYHLSGYDHPERIFQLHAPGLQQDFPALRGQRIARHNLPPARDRFIDREAEREVLLEDLDSYRLISIVGPGGSGKTRLAIELVRDRVESFRDGVWMVHLASSSPGSEISETICASLPFDSRGGAPALERLVTSLEHRQCLLLIDNCDHVLEGARTSLTAILDNCPAMRLLVTSRQPLQLRGERVLRLDPLELPGGDRAALSAAEQLFLDRVRMQQNRSDARGSDTSQRAIIAEICHALDGLPLAIELVAAMVSSLGLQDLLPALRADLGLLRAESKPPHPAHHSVEACVAWSVGRLEPAQRRLFGHLASLQGSWDLDAPLALYDTQVEVAHNEVLAALAGLVERSLVIAETGPGGSKRYRMLGTIAHYARRELEASGEAQRIRQRQAAHYLERAAGSDGSAPAPRVDLDTDLPNLLIAFETAASDAALVPSALAAIADLWRHHGSQKRQDDLGRIIERVLALPEARSEANGYAAATLGLGILRFLAADYRGAHALYLRCLTLEGFEHDARLRLRLYGNLGASCQQLGDLDGARAWYRRAMALAEEFGDPEARVRLELNLGALEEACGASRPAAEHLQRSLSLLEEAGLDAPALQARLMSMLARSLSDLGEPQRAARLWQDALGRYEALDEPAGMSICLRGLGCMAATRGDLTEAKACIVDAIELARVAQSPIDLANALLEQGRLALEGGEPTAACRPLAQSLEIRLDAGDAQGVADAVGLLATAKRRAGARHLLADLGLIAERLLASDLPRSEAERQVLQHVVGAGLQHRGMGRLEGRQRELRTLALPELIERLLSLCELDLPEAMPGLGHQRDPV